MSVAISHFCGPCDHEIGRMTLKNNGVPLLCPLKICASWYSKTGIKIGIITPKHRNPGQNGEFWPMSSWNSAYNHEKYSTPICATSSMCKFKLELQSGNGLWPWPWPFSLTPFLSIPSIPWTLHDDIMRGSLWKGMTDVRTGPLWFIELLGAVSI